MKYIGLEINLELYILKTLIVLIADDFCITFLCMSNNYSLTGSSTVSLCPWRHPFLSFTNKIIERYQVPLSLYELRLLRSTYHAVSGDHKMYRCKKSIGFVKRLFVFSVIIRHKRNDCSISVSTFLLGDSFVDASVHAEYKDHPQEAEHSPCLLEVDPVEHQFIVSVVSLS